MFHSPISPAPACVQRGCVVGRDVGIMYVYISAVRSRGVLAFGASFWQQRVYFPFPCVHYV
jgi:hypothetical protein